MPARRMLCKQQTKLNPVMEEAVVALLECAIFLPNNSMVVAARLGLLLWPKCHLGHVSTVVNTIRQQPATGPNDFNTVAKIPGCRVQGKTREASDPATNNDDNE
jgi:hypothetical protein